MMGSKNYAAVLFIINIGIIKVWGLLPTYTNFSQQLEQFGLVVYKDMKGMCKVSRSIDYVWSSYSCLKLNNWMCVEAWFCLIWSHIANHSLIVFIIAPHIFVITCILHVL